MNKKKTSIIIALVVGGVLTVFSGIVVLSYSYFNALINGNDKASSIIIDTAKIASVNFTDSAQINASNILPGKSITKNFSVSMNGDNTVPMSYKIYMYWKNTGITDMIYTLTTSGGTVSTNKAINTVQNNYKKDEIAMGTFQVSTAGNHTYTLIVTFPETGKDQNAQQGKTWDGYLQVEFVVGSKYICFNEENPNGYACDSTGNELVMLGNTACSSDSDNLNCKVYALNRTNGKTIQIVTNDTMFANISNASQTGLWLENRVGKTEDNKPVYFFRGTVQNNYVSFAGKMWRIVRINEDGTIKLVLGGNTSTDGYGGTTTKYNPNRSEATYIDYSLSTNALKTANETWYKNNIGNNNTYSGKIASTMFCNDKSIVSTSGGTTYYGAETRIGYNGTNSPQYKCPNSSDNLVYNVGALTADEVVYAGGKYFTNNLTYYLYENAQSSDLSSYWWLLSPRHFDNGWAGVFSVNISDSPDFSGFLKFSYVNTTNDFRPVVSLKSDTIILGGNGQQATPFVITE